MLTPITYSLPYFQDSAALFAAFANQPWAVFLDSAYPYSQHGRYDIMAVDPVCVLLTLGDETEIICQGISARSMEDPFTLIKQQLDRFSLANEPVLEELPFTGGAIGYFSYDLARSLEHLPIIAEAAEQIPDMAVGIYQWAVIVDHQLQVSCLVARGIDTAQCQRLVAQFSQLPEPIPSNSFQVLGDVTANMDKATYTQAFNRIKRYLQNGDCYQVNLTQRFAAPCQGNPWVVYQLLRQLNAAPFSCYLNLPDVQILSSSPERFLLLNHGLVETKPIKGTRPRKIDAAEDQLQIEQLSNSPKDRAENVMIVDLLRNDISKTCQWGSVKVPTLFAVESYATVHHLVSTVTGQLAEGQHAVDLLRSCFPGGSITGAPKIRAMEIIEELEPNRRGVYCGSVGYIGFNGNMDTNIAIRTLVHAQGSIRFWVGGGIVNDSLVDEEYQECFDKAAALLEVLRQLTRKPD